MLSLLSGITILAIGWWGLEKTKRKTHPVPGGLRPDISLPYDQEFELYHNVLSLCSMKSRLCMSELGIPYKSHHIDLVETGAYENIRPRFLAVNPGGTVPVLVHNGHPIYESHLQIRYAAEHAPAGSPKLTPDDPSLRKDMNDWIDRSSITHDPLEHGDESAGNAIPGLTIPLFAAMIDQIPTWKILEGMLFHFDKKRPALFLALKFRGLEKFHTLRPIVKLVARSRRQMATHLDALEKQLNEQGGPWILGETFSLADVSWLVIFERLVQADSLHVFLGGRGEPPDLRPECAAYFDRLRDRPGYREAIEGHSHPIVQHGTKRLREAKMADAALRIALEGS